MCAQVIAQVIAKASLRLVFKVKDNAGLEKTFHHFYYSQSFCPRPKSPLQSYPQPAEAVATPRRRYAFSQHPIVVDLGFLHTNCSPCNSSCNPPAIPPRNSPCNSLPAISVDMDHDGFSPAVRPALNGDPAPVWLSSIGDEFGRGCYSYTLKCRDGQINTFRSRATSLLSPFDSAAFRRILGDVPC